MRYQYPRKLKVLPDIPYLKSKKELGIFLCALSYLNKYPSAAA